MTMKKYFKCFIVLAALLAAMPCAAQLKDKASAFEALKSTAAKDRLGAIYYLGAQREPAAYKALASHFKIEKDAYLRVQIVETLDVRGSTWAYACASSAAGDASKSVRQAAASALAPSAGDAQADKKLKALAADPSEPVRLAALNSLSLETSTSAVAIIGGVLSDLEAAPEIRRAAAGVLSRMKTPEAGRELDKHLADPDPEIAAAAGK